MKKGGCVAALRRGVKGGLEAPGGTEMTEEGTETREEGGSGFLEALGGGMGASRGYSERKLAEFTGVDPKRVAELREKMLPACAWSDDGDAVYDAAGLSMMVAELSALEGKSHNLADLGAATMVSEAPENVGPAEPVPTEAELGRVDPELPMAGEPVLDEVAIAAANVLEAAVAKKEACRELLKAGTMQADMIAAVLRVDRGFVDKVAGEIAREMSQRIPDGAVEDADLPDGAVDKCPVPVDKSGREGDMRVARTVDKSGEAELAGLLPVDKSGEGAIDVARTLMPAAVEPTPGMLTRARQYRDRQPDEYWECVWHLRKGTDIGMVARMFVLDADIASGVYELARNETAAGPEQTLKPAEDAVQEKLEVVARARNKRIVKAERLNGQIVRVIVENNGAYVPRTANAKGQPILCKYLRQDLWTIDMGD